MALRALTDRLRAPNSPAPVQVDPQRFLGRQKRTQEGSAVNVSETAELIRLIQALCPAQKNDEYIAETWHLILEPIDYTDAVRAIKNIGTTNDKRPMFIDPRMIYNEAKTIRQNRRNKANPTPTENNRPPTNPAEYCEWMRKRNHQQAQLEKHQYTQNHTITY